MPPSSSSSPGSSCRRIDNHVVVDILYQLVGSNDLGSGNCWERSQDLGDITPPLLAESLVPVNGDGHSVREAGLLFPAELSKLGAVDGISVIVERTINGVLDPLVELFLCRVGDVEVSEELGAQSQVGDLVV